jgi:hypothetical protein
VGIKSDACRGDPFPSPILARSSPNPYRGFTDRSGALYLLFRNGLSSFRFDPGSNPFDAESFGDRARRLPSRSLSLSDPGPTESELLHMPR